MTEVELEVEVQVLDAVRGAPATRHTPPAPDEVTVCVRLGTLEITDALPVEVLAALEVEALERLRAAAEEP